MTPGMGTAEQGLVQSGQGILVRYNALCES